MCRPLRVDLPSALEGVELDVERGPVPAERDSGDATDGTWNVPTTMGGPCRPTFIACSVKEANSIVAALMDAKLKPLKTLSKKVEPCGVVCGD